jgi:2-polyprenyl-6-methoxyphenol hydroxylase-like FAD-dependent oxidoreductase
MVQVVIVGAGPAGAALALLLVRHGIAVTLVEAAKDFHRVFRGEGLMPSGLDALEQMGLSELLAQIPHRPLDAWEFMVGGKTLFQVEEPMGASQPCTLVSQPPLLQALVAEAQRHEGFELIQGVAVKDLLRQGDRITGVTLADGREMAADLVIGTDGRNSVVRQRAGLELIRQPQPIDVLWFKLAAHPRFVQRNVFLTLVQGGNVFSVFHGAEAGKLHLAWVLAAGEKADWKHKNWAEVFAALSPDWLADHFHRCADTLESPLKLSVVVGRCPRWYGPGVLLLGDAAHPMSPVRAQGINVALRDVIVAVNHLVPVLTAGASPVEVDAALAQIQAEREPEIIRAQALQYQEAGQGERLRQNPLARAVIVRVAPLFRPVLQQVWLKRQRQLRQGVTAVRLEV